MKTTVTLAPSIGFVHTQVEGETVAIARKEVAIIKRRGLRGSEKPGVVLTLAKPNAKEQWLLTNDGWLAVA